MSVSLPRTPPILDRVYWLEHCDGFRVDGRNGRIGVVEEVRRAAGGESLLVIRAGALGVKLITISTREVFTIVPSARRLWLRTPEAASRWQPEFDPESDKEPLESRVRVAA